MKKWMNHNTSNGIKVITSNLLLLLAGVLTSFVLPAIMTQSDYGLYKVFNLYTTYIILLQFGIIEAVYIKYGGKTIDDISKKEFSSYFKILTGIEIFIAALITIFSVVCLKDDNRFIGIAFAINIVIVNVTNLFQYLSQSIQRFNELSIRNIFKAIFTVLSVIILWIISAKKDLVPSYKIYVVVVISINFILMLWYVFSYRKLITFNAKISFGEFKQLTKLGMPLCLSNIISVLILSMDRQIVSLLFDSSEYAIYSFAYSMLMLISTIVTSISVVVFPMFKQQDEKHLLSKYGNNIFKVSALVSMIAVVYFMLCPFIEYILPSYTYSLKIFRIIIPGMMINSAIGVVIHNYYKALNKNFVFLIISGTMLLASIISNIVAFIIFESMESISWTSVVVMIVWYIILDCFLYKKYKISSRTSLIYLLVITIGFYIITKMEHWFISMLLYFIFLLVVTFLFYHLRKNNGVNKSEENKKST